MTEWAQHEENRLIHLYPVMANAKIAEKMGRTVSSISNRAVKLGLKKSRAYMEKHPGGFPKGGEPWNKGIPWNSGGRSSETHFKPGSKPQTTVPVGTISAHKDGCLKQKVRCDYEREDNKRNWKFIHVIEWEKNNGPLPDGWIVRFADGNNRNFDKDNLVAVSRAEHAIINKWMRVKDMPPGGLHALALAARIHLKGRHIQRGGKGMAVADEAA